MIGMRDIIFIFNGKTGISIFSIDGLRRVNFSYTI